MHKFFCFVVALSITMVFTPNMAAANVPSQWAAEEVEQAIRLNLVPTELQQGYQDAITRAEFCKLTMQMLTAVDRAEDSTHSGATFTDTNDPDILAAANLQIVNGMGDGTFRPDGNITRAQAAAMLMRAAALTGTYQGLPHIYDDGEQIPTWARESIDAAYACGIMRGTPLNQFLPENSYTREEAISVTLRLQQTIKNGVTESPMLYPMTRDDLWGYVDAAGQFIIAPQYKAATAWNSVTHTGMVRLTDPSACWRAIDENNQQVGTGNAYQGDFISQTPDVAPRWLGNLIEIPYHDGYGAVLYQIPSGKRFSSKESSISVRFFKGILKLSTLDHSELLYTRQNTQLSDSREFAFFSRFYNKLGVKKLPQQNTAYLIGTDMHSISKITPPVYDACGDLICTQINWVDDVKYEYHELFGAVRPDGTVILPTEYAAMYLTDLQQIIAIKAESDPLALYDKSGKRLYEFPAFFKAKCVKHISTTLQIDTSAIACDQIGNYLFRSTNDEVSVLNTNGQITATLSLPAHATATFVEGLVQIIDSENHCSYYTVSGKKVLI